MRYYIPYYEQRIAREGIDSVVDILRSDILTQGQIVPLLERKLTEIKNAKFVTVVNSATPAIHTALLALDMQPNDPVWTLPNIFAASANSHS